MMGEKHFVINRNCLSFGTEIHGYSFEKVKQMFLASENDAQKFNDLLRVSFKFSKTWKALFNLSKGYWWFEHRKTNFRLFSRENCSFEIFQEH